MLDTVLVANRGEVARRVLKACRELGIETVAVYSEADRDALFVDEADQAVAIGPAEPEASYLDQAAMIEAAEATGAKAIHPGYGFLSENADFAQRVQDAGLVWVGPSPEAMGELGDKVQARQLAIDNDVPVSPGSDTALDSVDEAREIADEIGYPVMLKAAAGGGGMGMRHVESSDEVEKAFESASEQARSAFGDGSLFLEKFVERPRHIEVQILGGPDGEEVVHLGERECSIQRRHQKLVEEAPSPALSDKQREALGEKAARMARAGSYANAGTLEFLYDGEEFYFNEMNTRLQVEHPVTEFVTGIDLVQAQLLVASGQAPPVDQADVTFEGHAIEVRVNAEDPYQEFLPSFGTVSRFEPPTGEGIRVDHSLEEGYRVPSAYDSLLAKFIAYGHDRTQAIQRLRGAVNTARVGCTTNLALHRHILADRAFQEGELSTAYLEERGLLETLADEGERRAEGSRRRAAALTAALAMGSKAGIGVTYHRQTRPARRDADEGGSR
jgi:acetyl-CoA carboxylase biotin carboxylase subunit